MTHIICDFDRTITCLYPKPQFLFELRSQVTEYFRNSGVPHDVVDGTEADGYHAWHFLHKWAMQNFEEPKSSIVVRGAEALVTEFEIERANVSGLLLGVREGVEFAHSNGVGLSIVSSNSVIPIETFLKKEDLIGIFSQIIGRPMHPFDPRLLKPAPDLILQSIENLPQSSLLDCWYIGDDVIDIQAAHAAGIRCASVSSGNYSMEQLGAAGADIVTERFDTAIHTVFRTD